MIRSALVGFLFVLSSVSFAAKNPHFKKRRLEESVDSACPLNFQQLQINSPLSTNPEAATSVSSRRAGSGYPSVSLLSPFLQRVEKRSFERFNADDPAENDGINAVVYSLLNLSRHTAVSEKGFIAPSDSSSSTKADLSSSSSSSAFADPTKTSSGENSHSGKVISTKSSPENDSTANAETISIASGNGDSVIDLTFDDNGVIGEISGHVVKDVPVDARVPVDTLTLRQISVKTADQCTKRNLDFLLANNRRADLVKALLTHLSVCEELGEHYLRVAMESKDLSLIAYMLDRIFASLTNESPDVHYRMFFKFFTGPNTLFFMNKKEVGHGRVFAALLHYLETDRPHDFVVAFVTNNIVCHRLLNGRLADKLRTVSNPKVAIKLRSLFHSQYYLGVLSCMIIRWKNLTPIEIHDALRTIFGDWFEESFTKLCSSAFHERNLDFFKLVTEVWPLDAFNPKTLRSFLSTSTCSYSNIDYIRQVIPLIRCDIPNTGDQVEVEFGTFTFKDSIIKTIIEKDASELLKNCMFCRTNGAGMPSLKIFTAAEFNEMIKYAMSVGSTKSILYIMSAIYPREDTQMALQVAQWALKESHYHVLLAIVNFYKLPLADVCKTDAVNPEGDILAYAVRNREVFEQLLKMGANKDVMVNDVNNETIPLVEWLIRKKAFKMAKMLIEAGARIDIDRTMAVAERSQDQDMLDFVASITAQVTDCMTSSNA